MEDGDILSVLLAINRTWQCL